MRSRRRQRFNAYSWVLKSLSNSALIRSWSLSVLSFSVTLVLMNHSLCMTSSIDNRASPHDPSITLLISGGAHTAQTPRQTQVIVRECVDIHWAHTHSFTRDLFIHLSVYLSVLSCASNVTTRNETSRHGFKQDTAGDKGKGQRERREERVCERREIRDMEILREAFDSL